ncbi:phage tail assembly protein [Sphingobium sp. B11D3D]|uniref:phage tail assembly protein n=1 Tax=Sphingobium sp. B11D3D TaxID=2940576 RepID=UPI0022251F1C|nr:phage tail assembly protein [Sphingobium sp. B11D3D]MCW2370190.1 hypothetical protein [Sphingobium sp. B11D3D]
MSDHATSGDGATPAVPHVILENPIKRGDTEIRRVDLRKPKAGELRGISLQALGQSDVQSLITVIPRITMPPLTEPEVANLEVEDLAAFGNVIFGFFLTPAQRQRIEESLGI